MSRHIKWVLTAFAGSIIPFLFTSAAFAQCTFTVGPLPPVVDSAAQTLSVTITATAQTCAWTSTAAGFTTIKSGASGNANGTTVVTVQSNNTGAVRTANLTVAGQTVALTQHFTAQPFADLFPPDFYFDGASLLRQHLITGG